MDNIPVTRITEPVHRQEKQRHSPSKHCTSLLSQGSRSNTVNDKSVTGPKNPTKLTVSLMKTACIQEKGSPMTLFGITFPQAPGSSLQCFHPGATAFTHTGISQARSPGRHTCPAWIILARGIIISLGGLLLKEESICTLKCRFCFLPPRSGPVMTFCNTSNHNTFPVFQ